MPPLGHQFLNRIETLTIWFPADADAGILLTTPESLEVMLISSRVDKRVFFGNLRMVIVDELHAFAGDDRGWHLLSVLERLTRIF